MRFKLIISGLIIGGVGFAVKYYSLFESPYISYGAMGVGIFLILLGLVMRRRF